METENKMNSKKLMNAAANVAVAPLVAITYVLRWATWVWITIKKSNEG